MNLELENMKHWLETLYKSIGLDYLYNDIDSLLNSGDFISVNAILKSVDLSKISIVAGLGLLTITYAAKDKLPERSEFYNKFKIHLKKNDIYGIDAILKDLD